jgi:predicted permease
MKSVPEGFRPEFVRAVPLGQAFRPADASTLFAWQGAVGLVLLITCANVGNLMLVRSSARRREIAIRTAVGGGHWQVVRQLLTESALLALTGGIVGVIAGATGVRYLDGHLPANFGRMLRGADPFGIDANIVMFTLAASLLTVLLFGLAPALTAFRVDVMSGLRDSGRGTTHDRRRFGQTLIASEIALALVLLIGAGLTLKSLAGLQRAYLGFSPDRVLRVAVELPGGLPDFDTATSRLAAMPGVDTVGVLAPQFFPFGGPAVRGAIFRIAGRDGVEARAEVYTANPAYFRAVQIPLLKGRLFSNADTVTAPQVALVSDIVAKRYWPGEDPVGRLIRLSVDDPSSPWLTVVGVVGDVRNPVGRGRQPTAYRPLAQNTPNGAILLVRTWGEPLALAPAIQRELRSLFPSVPEFRVADLQQAVRDYISPQQFSTSVFGSFAFVGLILAAMGVYGVMRYWVSVRVAELGVRIALGASQRDVIELVIRKALVAVLAGVIAGVLVSFALHRAIESRIYDVSPTDPLVFACVVALMIFVACAAAAFPARWASRVDPVQALRHD